MRFGRYLFLLVLGLTTGVVLFACAEGAAPDVPEIVINPSSGGPGTQVTIRGSGFPADTELNVRLGPPNVGATPQSYGHVLPGAQGEFVLSLIMPDQWPDGTSISESELLVVIINDDGSIKAAAPFSFEPNDATEPALSLTPGNGTPGEQVMVNGHYFRAGARVGLHLSVPETNAGNAKLVEVQVDGSGAFETTLAIPSTWPDSGAAITEQDLVITAVDESVGQEVASVSFFNFEGQATNEGPENQPITDPEQFYTNEEGGFSLVLPPNWVVQGPISTSLGSHYLLGPPTLEQAGPSNSSILVANAGQFSPEEVAAQLCGGCTSLPALQDAVVNGVEAKLATIGGEGAPALEWVFVQNEGKLICLSIHDPETLQSLDGVVQSFSPGGVPLGPVTLPAAHKARQWLATHLGVNPYTIVIVNADRMEWTDACLGVAAEGEMCAQVVTPGYTGILKTRTAQYEYRVDQSGTNVRVTPGAAIGARQLIAQQLQVNLNAVSIVSFERVDWPDACLGVVAVGEVCAQAATPGYRVVLETGDQRYEVHTDDAGEVLRLASAPEPEINDAALVWTYHGDGGCQMAIFGSETVAFGICGTALMSGKYAVPERAEAFIYFVETFLSFDAETPAGSVRFSGQGTSEAPPSVQRMIAEWARLAQLEALGGRSGASYGLALAWHREGGSAGFCDDLAVYVTGEVFASSCRGEQPENLGRGRLTAVQLGQLYAWVDGLKSFEFEEMQPATADATTVRMVFSGSGAADATEADKHTIEAFAAHLFKEFSAGAVDS